MPAPATPIVVPPGPLPCIPQIEPALLKGLLLDVDEKGQVIVHCTVLGDDLEQIRIWPSTYLICRHSGHRSRLVHAEGIVMPPFWMPMSDGGTAQFTLFFEGLPKHCVLFDLLEEIPEQGAFKATSILRNAMDVYRVGLD